MPRDPFSDAIATARKAAYVGAGWWLGAFVVTLVSVLFPTRSLITFSQVVGMLALCGAPFLLMIGVLGLQSSNAVGGLDAEQASHHPVSLYKAVNGVASAWALLVSVGLAFTLASMFLNR